MFWYIRLYLCTVCNVFNAFLCTELVSILLFTHHESGFQLDLAVCSGALQLEALVNSHVGGVEEATQGQVENAELSFLLMLFDLEHKNSE